MVGVEDLFRNRYARVLTLIVLGSAVFFSSQKQPAAVFLCWILMDIFVLASGTTGELGSLYNL